VGKKSRKNRKKIVTSRCRKVTYDSRVLAPAEEVQKPLGPGKRQKGNRKPDRVKLGGHPLGGIATCRAGGEGTEQGSVVGEIPAGTWAISGLSRNQRDRQAGGKEEVGKRPGKTQGTERRIMNTSSTQKMSEKRGGRLPRAKKERKRRVRGKIGGAKYSYGHSSALKHQCPT